MTQAELDCVDTALIASIPSDRLASDELIYRLNDAVQCIVDRLSHSDSATLLPDGMKIIANALQARTAGYFEIDRDLVIRLRYWLAEDRLIESDQLESDPEWGNHAAPRILVDGFTVPEGYLDTPIGRRTKPMIIDHSNGTSVAIFDDWLHAHDCSHELNIPVVVRGRDVGTLCLLRSSRSPFTLEEVNLAESLVKPLALILEVSRLGLVGQAVSINRVCNPGDKTNTSRTEPQEGNRLVVGPGRMADPLKVFILQATAAIDRHLASGNHQALTIKALAREAGYSPGHYATLFRTATNVSPHTHILRSRLSKAKSLLEQGHSVSWIASECGFCDRSHLSRQFKIHYGIAPSSPAARNAAMKI